MVILNGCLDSLRGDLLKVLLNVGQLDLGKVGHLLQRQPLGGLANLIQPTEGFIVVEQVGVLQRQEYTQVTGLVQWVQLQQKGQQLLAITALEEHDAVQADHRQSAQLRLHQEIRRSRAVVDYKNGLFKFNVQQRGDVLLDDNLEHVDGELDLVGDKLGRVEDQVAILLVTDCLVQLLLFSAVKLVLDDLQGITSVLVVLGTLREPPGEPALFCRRLLVQLLLVENVFCLLLCQLTSSNDHF